MQKKTKDKKAVRNRARRLVYIIPSLMLCTILLFGASAKAIPDHVYTDSVSDVEDEVLMSSETADGVDAGVTEQVSEHSYTAKLFGFIPAKTVEGRIPSDLKLVPGGDVFGIKFFTKGVVITEISEVEGDEGIISPAGKAGLKKGDVIISVNGHEVNTVEEMTDFVSSSDGKEMTLGFVRDGKNFKAKLKPIKALSDGEYKAGLWVRDSTAGIGTVTFYDPKDGSFAGLGHGIYDADTELLLPLLRGAVVDIELTDIIKGAKGHPGELKGIFGNEKTGTVLGNTVCGVYGVLTQTPESASEALPCSLKDEVTEGEASIYANVDGRGVREYAIEIAKIYSGNEETKNFVIEVKDDRLLSLTGGIVRGMSGSPIVQNGKLVGAVTHVLVNDPTRGYGIFIENMLAEAEKIK